MARRIGRAACIALAVVALAGSIAAAQEAPKGAKHVPEPSSAKVPSPEVLLVLIRSALIGLDHANRTGNYSVMREMGGPSLQRLSSGQLSTAFASLRTGKVDLLPTVILTPQLTVEPTVSEQGLLKLVGYFPTQPKRVQFQIVYQPADGQWRLAGLDIGLADTSAPEAKTAPPEESKPKAKAAPAPKK